MNDNLMADFDCFIDKCLLKYLVVNDNVYLMTSFSMSRSWLLQFSSRQCFGLTGSDLKKAREIIETNLRVCYKKVIIWSRCALCHIGTG